AGLLFGVLCGMFFSSVFYPPFWHSILVVAVLLSLAYDRAKLDLRMLGLIGVAYGTALVLFFIYFRETLWAMLGSPSFAHRYMPGGGTPRILWAGLFCPGLIAEGNEPALATYSVCEASSIGSYLPLLCLFFVDYRQLWQTVRAASSEGRRLRWTFA